MRAVRTHSSTSPPSSVRACARCKKTSASATISSPTAAARWRRPTFARPTKPHLPATAERPTTAIRGKAARLSSRAPVRHSTDLDFYLARADQARREAEAATLDHVRERCQRSQAAWEALADRAARTIKMRDEHDRAKAAAVEVEPELAK